MTAREVIEAFDVDWLEPFDLRRALQLLSHAARTRRLQGYSPVRHSFIVLFDISEEQPTWD